MTAYLYRGKGDFIVQTKHLLDRAERRINAKPGNQSALSFTSRRRPHIDAVGRR